MLRPWSRLAKIHLRQRFTPHNTSTSIFPLNDANQIHGGHTVASAGAAGAVGAAGSAPAILPFGNPAENSTSGSLQLGTKHQGGVLCTKSAAFGVRESYSASVVSICTVGHNCRSQ
jgi:hypothetical protein